MGGALRRNDVDASKKEGASAFPRQPAVDGGKSSTFLPNSRTLPRELRDLIGYKKHQERGFADPGGLRS
jgi:hypothetical protein